MNQDLINATNNLTIAVKENVTAVLNPHVIDAVGFFLSISLSVIISFYLLRQWLRYH